MVVVVVTINPVIKAMSLAWLSKGERERELERKTKVEQREGKRGKMDG